MEPNYGLKRTADILTAIRFLGAVAVPVVGSIQGPSSVSGLAGWLLLLLWLTDLFDGWLARKSGLAGEGFFGQIDGWVDLALALGSFTLLYITGFVSVGAWAAVMIATAFLVRADFLVFQGLAVFFLTVFYFVVASAQDPAFLLVIVVFLGVCAVLSRERFVVLCKRFWEHLRKR